MKEYIVFIRNEGDPAVKLSPERQREHIQKVGSYIGSLIEGGKMIAAQPLEMEGTMFSFKNGNSPCYEGGRDKLKTI